MHFQHIYSTVFELLANNAVPKWIHIYICQHADQGKQLLNCGLQRKSWYIWIHTAVRILSTSNSQAFHCKYVSLSPWQWCLYSFLWWTVQYDCFGL